jgi:UDP-glucose 4-epimerase
VGTGVRTSIREVADLLIDITGTKVGIQYLPAGQTFVKNRIGCPKRAQAEIGFTAQLPLRQGLERLIEWRDSHKAAVARSRSASA